WQRPWDGAAPVWVPPPRGPSHHTRWRRRRPERGRGAGHQERGEEALGDAVAALAEGARVVGRGDGDGRVDGVEGVRKQEGKRDADCHANLPTDSRTKNQEVYATGRNSRSMLRRQRPFLRARAMRTS
ncbi:unnamed protein product, partial [Urochloa humidicola]